MAIQSYKLGPGTLLLGSAPLDISAQVTSCQVAATENVSTTEAVDVLSGLQLAAEEDVTFSYVISGNLLQALEAGGVVDWTWENAGQVVDFVFVPRNDVDRAVGGQCTIVPVTIGGDVKTRPQSDFSFRCSGTPVFGVYDPVTDIVTEDV